MQPTQRTPLLSAILQDYALRRRVFYQKKTGLFLQLARGDVGNAVAVVC